MGVHRNVLSTIMSKNAKLSNGNVRLKLVRPEIHQTRNLSSNSRTMLACNHINSVVSKIYIGLRNFEKSATCTPVEVRSIQLIARILSYSDIIFVNLDAISLIAS